MNLFPGLLRRLPGKRRDLLQLAILINLIATPGLGSWIAHRRLAAYGQLAIVLAGFGGFLVYLFRMLADSWTAAWNGLDPLPLPPELLNRSLAVMGIAWVWSAFTSLQLYREIRRLDRATPPPLNTPPRLDPGS
jgi:hypothetical protein